jgi:enoyl-[acyl-carrier-protein] reductase (NADH)
MSDVNDKVLIVTGASRGIGAAAARLFSKSGASVVLAARDEQALQTVASEIAREGRQALAAPTDVTDAAAVARLVAVAVERYGRLDGASTTLVLDIARRRSLSWPPRSSTRSWTPTCEACSSVCAPSSSRWPAVERS